MYMAMIWWLQNRKEGASGWLRCATWYIVSHYASWYRHLRSGSRANWCQAERLWAKWENYTFAWESAVVVGVPFTVRLQSYVWQRQTSGSLFVGGRWVRNFRRCGSSSSPTQPHPLGTHTAYYCALLECHHQTEKVRNYLVNFEHLAAKEPDISFTSWLDQKQSWKGK